MVTAEGTYGFGAFGLAGPYGGYTVGNPVFANKDGTDFPEYALGWTVQGNAVNPGQGTKVFTTIDKTDTPANVAGWTVQNSGA